MKVLSSTQARQNFFGLQDDINDNVEIRIKFKSTDAVMLNAKDYENLIETLYVLEDPIVAQQLKNLPKISTSSYDSVDELKNQMDS